MNEQHIENFFIQMRSDYEEMKKRNFISDSKVEHLFYLEILALIFEDMARSHINAFTVNEIINAAVEGCLIRINKEIEDVTSKLNKLSDYNKG